MIQQAASPEVACCIAPTPGRLGMDHARHLAGELVTVRDARPDEHEALGELLVGAYSRLPDFPGPADQPVYYEMLANIGAFARRPGARLLVATTDAGRLAGGVVYFGDMAEYGSGGIATSVRDASGIRLLGVDQRYRGAGVGRALTHACIDAARQQSRSQVILHTTGAMQIAWRMYEKLGFVRSHELDFLQNELPVFGFRLRLT